MPFHRLITSGSLPCLETALLRQIAEQKGKDPLQPVIVLCASSFLGHCLSRELARRGLPHLGISFLTCNDLAAVLGHRALLAQELSPLPGGGKELILRRLLRELPSGSYFARVRDLPHLPLVLAATLTDIEDSRIDFAKAARHASSTSSFASASGRKTAELIELYAAYGAELARRHLLTEAGLLAEAGRHTETFASLFGADHLLVYGFYELTGAQRELLHRLSSHIGMTAFLLAEEDPRAQASAALHKWWKARPAEEKTSSPGSSPQRSGRLTDRGIHEPDRRQERWDRQSFLLSRRGRGGAGNSPRGGPPAAGRRHSLHRHGRPGARHGLPAGDGERLRADRNPVLSSRRTAAQVGGSRP